MLDASNPHILADHVVHGPVDPEAVEIAQSAGAVRHEANDNQADPARDGERRTFELPRVIWIGMIACYVVFLAALLAATGAGRAGFAIAISAVYVIMFFGTARAVARQSPRQAASPLERQGASLQTAFGPMSRGAVFGQILVVPVAVAMFGVAVSVIIALVT